ncbi:MAG: hypothetical protein EOQ40_02450 [Mesorhizobium sp.]|uniref:hypothetical protein n=1 Tax=Mesorhizobium sp. TaxID=1871066 RepID=UPI000FE8BA1E|nr:hypothetical protein [Mesorhizobium sp.]RWB23101.1 MAG: hypothetical protein EOQ40_02450 [Mesorhizobium sp.]
MPRGYWRVILAFGCLIVVGLGYLAYQELQGSEIDTYPDASYQPARNATFPPAPKEHQARTEHYDPHCQEPANREDSDLCAQWSAVEAVNESNRLVRVSLNVVALEFGALVVSLIFTGWAAVAAAQAARAANQSIENERAGAAAEALRFSQQYGEMKRSADAAEASIKETRHIGERQLRAYLVIDRIEAEVSKRGDLGRVFDVKVTLKNTGQTPALSTNMGVELNLFSRPFRTLANSYHNSIQEVGSGGERNVAIQWPVDDEVLFSDGKFHNLYGVFQIIVRHRYRDYLDREWARDVEYRAAANLGGTIPMIVRFECGGDIDREDDWTRL